MSATVLSGARVVLPERVLEPGALVIEGARIAAIVDGHGPGTAGVRHVELSGHTIVPGFIDVHVHGAAGDDTLDPDAPIRRIARRLLRYGVTAFCPTTVACAPGALAGVLAAVRLARERPDASAARVLPAHLESNFINPDYRGAQPCSCLRHPPAFAAATPAMSADDHAFSAAEVLDVIATHRESVGIVTLAPELDGGLALIEALVAQGHRVSLGHSGASYETAIAAVKAGARHATHLFNRMPPLHHREPGLAGAVLGSAEVAAEIICDGYHVHPAVVRTAIAAKGAARVMAITDATAGAGLPSGATARLGGREIRVTEKAAFLTDGTLAGSTLTMDRAFRTLAFHIGLDLPACAALCSTTAADELRLTDQGRLRVGALADFVVLDDRFDVSSTWMAGTPAFVRPGAAEAAFVAAGQRLGG